MSKWTELVESYLSLVGRNPRSAHVASTVASDTALQRTLEQAAEMGQQNKVFARVAGTYEMPTVDRAAMAYGERGMPGRRSVEQAARDGVAEELGPFFREAPMEQVEDAQSLLGPTMGGEDLVSRLEGMTPRPLYALDLPGDTSVRSQMDATYGPFAFPPENRGLIVQGGRGVPVGGPTGSGVIVPGPTGLSTRVTPRQRIPGPPQRRIGTTAGVPVGAVTPRSSFRADAAPDINMMGMDEGSVLGWPDNMPRAAEPVRLESLDAAAERRALEQLAESISRRSRGGSPPRQPPAGQAQAAGGGGGNWKAALAAGVAGAGAGLWRLGSDFMSPVGVADEEGASGPDTTSRPKPSSTADLAAETSPPPSVMTQEPEPISPRDQAHALQEKLNEMRAKAGGEVPEAAAMRKEIQRLFDMSDAQTNASARKGVAPQGADPLSGARRILADLNAGRIPPAQRAQAQAEMQRLYRQADEQANARTTARRAG